MTRPTARTRQGSATEMHPKTRDRAHPETRGQAHPHLADGGHGH
jgi:hypothetical protein